MSEEQPRPPSEQPQPIPPQPVPPQQDFSQPPQYYQPHGYPQQPPGALDRLIPVRNVKALLAYYFGVFSFVPCFTIALAPAAIILGILGIKDCAKDPNMPGKGHAITGIVLGSLTLLIGLVVVLFVVVYGRKD